VFGLSSLSKWARRAAPQDVYAKPREISDVNECYFYHTMDIPGYGLVEGQWDLRDGIKQYTGGLDFRGQRVLELGTASGFVCFHMECQGAEVVAYDLSEEQSWDLVPFASADQDWETAKRRRAIRLINNSYWLAHKAFGSKAKVVYGTVYDIPNAIGPVDASTFCSVLVHLRDPFLALQNAARLTRDTILVTDLVTDEGGVTSDRAAPAGPVMWFLPDFRKREPLDAWWRLTPEIVVSFLGVLGFEKSQVSYHVQRSMWDEKRMFSVVARRTSGKPHRITPSFPT